MGVGRQDHAVDVGRIQVRVAQRASTSLGRHRSGGFVVGGEASGLDAGMGVDPFIGRVDLLADLFVGDDPLGTVGPDTEQSDVLGAAGRRDLSHPRPISFRRVCTLGADLPTATPENPLEASSAS